MHLHRAVIVTAADYNGKDFDGQPIRPLVPLKGDTSLYDAIPWFFDAVKEEKILIEARGCTDYAWFGVKDNYNNVHWAGPGDMIMRESPSGNLCVIPRPLVKHLERIVRDAALPNAMAREIKLMAAALQLSGTLRPLPLSNAGG